MNFDDAKDKLTPEQIERAKGCKSPEELLALSKEIGYELSDDELEAVAGGMRTWYCDEHTPNTCDTKLDS